MNTDYSSQFHELRSISQCLQLRDELLNSGRIAEIKSQIVTGSIEEKKILGQELATLRNTVQTGCDARIQEIQTEQEKDIYTEFDPSFYSTKYREPQGDLHPLTLIVDEIALIFGKMGFDVFDGNHIETQYHNFTSVNTPDYHPARDMQDTFFVEQKDQLDEHYVMRTQVTANAVKYAKTHKPPFRAIFPGIVFRNENIDATHDINFTQFDMWLIDKQVTMSQLITLIQYFFREFFLDSSLTVRLRPSYFPFTQPSMEGDISCPFCKGVGCRICKKTGWIEVFGAGPVHRNVIKNMDLNPDEWQGIAFGFGVDRLAQLKFGIAGISQFYNGNLGFLKGNS
jgi:phenylalanyl-tRNA synthetase alpha chain